MSNVLHAEGAFAARAAAHTGDVKAAVHAALKDAWASNPAVRAHARRILKLHGVEVHDDPPSALLADGQIILSGMDDLTAGEVG
jgi:hypothetical protein